MSGDYNNLICTALEYVYDVSEDDEEEGCDNCTCCDCDGCEHDIERYDDEEDRGCED